MTNERSISVDCTAIADGANIAVIILTHNEELHIDRALASIRSFAQEVFVIDSFSSDRTVEIAELGGATVLQREFVNQAKQFQWALNNAPITSEWIMRLDADEIIEADLAQEITSKLPQLSRDIAGVNLKRKHIFLDRWIKHGGRYPLELLRIWRNGQGRIEDRWMDEHMIVWGGKTVTFEGGFADHNLNDLTFFTDKHNKYATREAIDVLNQQIRFMPFEKALSAADGSFQAAIKRTIKERFYNRTPFYLAATGYFLFRYILQAGFLDGREGLIYHFLQGFWYRFLVGAKIEELKRSISGQTDPAVIAAMLTSLTGFKIVQDAEGETAPELLSRSA